MLTRPVQQDPLLTFKYRIEIQGIEAGAFSEISGLQVEIETHDYREGGVNRTLYKLAGPTRYPASLVLKRGVVDATLLWDWQQEIVEGRVTRRSGSIILMDSAGAERRRWNFRDAYPIRWRGPDLRAGTAEVAVETLELAHNGLTTQGG
ncbi:MAG: phage tail protein [Caldilineaceae bacterium]|nr:phage tail protein [Caldilineaceae bacterium]